MQQIFILGTPPFSVLFLRATSIMVTSSSMAIDTSTITPQLLDKVNSSLRRAQMCTSTFSDQLRKAYQQDQRLLTLDTQDYRRRLYSEAMMYGAIVYPTTINLVKEVQETLENYTLIDEFELFTDCVEDVRLDCLANSKRARKVQHGHTYVLTNLKRIDSDMRQHLNSQRYRVFDLTNGAISDRATAVNSENLGVGAAAGATALAPVLGLIISPLDGGLCALALTVIGAGATMAGNHLNARAARRENKAQVAYQNAAALEQLIQSVESLTEAIEIVASFVALMANELEGISQIGAGLTLRRLHWLKMKRKGQNLVDSCKAFLEIEPSVRSDMMSIKEDWEHDYRDLWQRGFRVFEARNTVE